MKVKNPKEVNLKNITEHIESLGKKETEKWNGDTWQVLIPMAGEGSRFKNAGYTFPKPLIEVNGKPMIQVAVENLNIKAEFIYIVRKEHYEKYNLKYLLNILTPNCKIVQVDHLTEGAAATTLLAKDVIDDRHLSICNSDQFMEWDSDRFYYTAEDTEIDGMIPVFENTHPKWSYVKVKDGYISEVAEKKPISTNATAGVYYWKKGTDYIKAAEEMIKKNIRTNNEFYIAPTYNEAILKGKKFKTYKIDKMWGLGTPEDLQTYLNDYPKTT